MTTNKNLLTGSRAYYKPFDYPQAFDFFEKHEQMHWIPTEVQMHEDVRDYWHKLTEDQRFIIHNSLKLFTQSDHDVEDAYIDIYFKIFNNYPEVRMMLNSFSSREAIHQWAYSYLNDTLDLPDSIYQEFFKYKAMLDKHNYLMNAKIDFNLKETNPEEYLRQIIKYIIINTAFTEGMMLFSSFVLMLNITRMEAGGKMPGMGEIIRWSIRDEECHIEGVSWLFRTLIEENPEVWTDELKKELYDIARQMVSLEDAFIDLCYDGENNRNYPGLSKEDLHTYIRWIADIRLNQFGLKKNWNVEKNPLPWVGDLSLPVNTSFFEEKGNAYSKGAVEIDNLEFE